MLVQIFDADYKLLNNKPLIRVFGKTDKGRPICVFMKGLLPYFFVDTENKDEVVSRLKGVREVVDIKTIKKITPITNTELLKGNRFGLTVKKEKK